MTFIDTINDIEIVFLFKDFEQSFKDKKDITIIDLLF